VMRIMPVLYSLLIASTATVATTAWPRSIPVRLTLAGSSWQPPPGQVTEFAAIALTAAVKAAAASNSKSTTGRRFFRAMARANGDWIGDMLADLSADDIAILMRLLAKTKASARKAIGNGGPR